MHSTTEWINRLKKATLPFLDLAFPRDCLLTGEAIEQDHPFRYIGPSAAKSIHWISEPRCLRCGSPLWGCTANTRTCSHCASLDPEFDGNRSAVLLSGATRRMVHQLKYHQGHYLQHDFARILAEAPGYLVNVRDSILILVPLHPRKLRDRGFNQSAIIAQLIDYQTKGTRNEHALIRRLDTESKTRLSREARIRNTRKASRIPTFQADPEAQYFSWMMYSPPEQPSMPALPPSGRLEPSTSPA